MADEIKDVSDRGSKEYVAWLLLRAIAFGENKTTGPEVKADKEWVLKTYQRCLHVTRSGSATDALNIK